MERRYRIRVARDRFKFSAAHMTVFPDGRKERLHGHNYRMAVVLDLASVAFRELVDFGAVKREVERICAGWKERMLLAASCPLLELIRNTDEEVEILLCGRRYVFPREDVIFLPVENVTVEALAGHAADLLGERLLPALPTGAVTALEVTVEETPGQGATCTVTL